MSLPELRLLPHEVGDLTPDHALCAPADWRVKTSWLGGEILVRVVEFTDDKRTLVARQQGKRGAPLLRLNVSHHAVISDESDDLIRNDLHQNQFERRLAFDADGRLVTAIEQTHALLHINFMGDTSWVNDWKEQFPFVWRGFEPKHRCDAKWRARTSDAQIEREIGERLADAACDCAFAWTWLHSSERQREGLLFTLARGSLDEVEALLRAVCVQGAQQLSGAGWHLLLDIAAGAGTEYYAGGATEILHHSHLSDDADMRRLSPQQVRLATLILRHFELWRNWNAQTYTLVQERWHYGNGYWQIPFSAPSMHDVLEARLQLRDWLRGKVSDDEIGELLT